MRPLLAENRWPFKNGFPSPLWGELCCGNPQNGQITRTISSKTSEWFASGRKVRKTIHELGGTVLENLPVAESIKKVASREKNRLKTRA